MLKLALFQTIDLSTLSAHQRARIERIDAAACEFAKVLDANASPSADCTTAMRHVLDAKTAAVRSVVHGGEGFYRRHAAASEVDPATKLDPVPVAPVLSVSADGRPRLAWQSDCLVKAKTDDPLPMCQVAGHVSGKAE